MVPPATVRTLKPKNLKNLKTFFKNLRFLPALVWTGTFGHTSSAIDSRHWRDPLFSSARDPIIIPGWSYINSDATWRMRTVHHTSESEERTKHGIVYQLQASQPR